MIVLALLALRAAPACATQTYPGPPSVAHLARGADVVVVGDVTSTAGEWDAGRTNIYTRVSVAVGETLKGPAGPTVSFLQLGGQVGDRLSAVGGAAHFRAGERVLVFLARRADGELGLADPIHGKFSVERDAATGREYAVRAAGAPGPDRVALDQVRAEVRRALGG
jgi:hypothetical protein